MAYRRACHYLPATVCVLIGTRKSPLGRVNKNSWRARIGTIKTLEPMLTLNVLDTIDGYGEPDIEKLEASLAERGAERIEIKFV